MIFLKFWSVSSFVVVYVLITGITLSLFYHWRKLGLTFLWPFSGKARTLQVPLPFTVCFPPGSVISQGQAESIVFSSVPSTVLG